MVQNTIYDQNQIEELEAVEELETAEKIQPVQEIKKVKSNRLPVLLRLTRRAVLFLFLTLVGTLLFFVTGNRQTFLDSNLIILLKITACVSIALSFFSMAAVAGNIFYLIKTKKIKFLIYLICYVLIFLLASVILVLSLSVNLLSEGINF
ncbi:hypothetical protein [Treponema sp.]|uniref:hypothetical protein n=1 Tax=Treponema sp. TaxID=166 RepID=UPI00388EE216